jgi:hypothetical protein
VNAYICGANIDNSLDEKLKMIGNQDFQNEKMTSIFELMCDLISFCRQNSKNCSLENLEESLLRKAVLETIRFSRYSLYGSNHED